MPATPTQERPKLTLRILIYAIFDAVGIALFATGALWLTEGTRLFHSDFPTSKVEAIAATAGGVFLMFWAATQILRELIRRPSVSTGKGH